MGLATQMIAWPDELCAGLARCGLFVIRFDNRDVGGSTHLRNLPPPRLADVVVRRRPPPYSIGDMAGDVVGLIDGLGLGEVHLVGASMGGFIAQAVALEHADRVRTLTLIMTSTGSRRVGQPNPGFTPGCCGHPCSPTGPRPCPRPSRRPGSSARAASRSTSSTCVTSAGRSWDRGYDPAGNRRQLAASVSQPNRNAALRRITVPALVIHGLHDPLVAPSGGLAIARAIPDSRFAGFSDMGHDLPRALWPEFVRQIAALTALGEQRRRQEPRAG